MGDEHDIDLRAEWVRLLAHDLRAPLTALTASIGFLEQKHHDLDSAYLLSAARDSLLRLSRIIDNVEVRGQFLDRAKPAEESVDVTALVREAAAALHSSLALREARLEVDVGPDPIVVTSDGEVLRVIVANALLNAIESSPLQGLVRIELRRDAGVVRLLVSDEGPSIPPDFAGQALDDHGQLELRRRAVRIGRGLTLIAVRLAADALGGRAVLEPAGARGCRLIVTVPVVG
jgi:K+-sensing histidine kinase KdpD